MKITLLLLMLLFAVLRAFSQVTQVGLSATNSGEDIVISWTPSQGTLQSSPVVGPGASWSTVGTQNPTNILITGGARFFRVGGDSSSSNMVGFATVTVPPGYSLLANPLDAGVTNGANEIMPILDGELILTWNGVQFIEVMYDSTAGGWVLGDDVTKTVPPSLRPGVGFFFFNPNPIATNFTFIGQVVPRPSGTNVVILESGYNLYGSALPATVAQITNPPVSLPVLDGMQILLWSGTNYNEVMFDSGAGGWVLADDVTKTTAPPYSIGEGFFLFNGSDGRVWVQSLP